MDKDPIQFFPQKKKRRMTKKKAKASPSKLIETKEEKGIANWINDHKIPEDLIALLYWRFVQNIDGNEDEGEFREFLTKYFSDIMSDKLKELIDLHKAQGGTFYPMIERAAIELPARRLINSMIKEFKGYDKVLGVIILNEYDWEGMEITVALHCEPMEIVWSHQKHILLREKADYVYPSLQYSDGSQRADNHINEMISNKTDWKEEKLRLNLTLMFREFLEFHKDKTKTDLYLLTSCFNIRRFLKHEIGLGELTPPFNERRIIAFLEEQKTHMGWTGIMFGTSSKTQGFVSNCGLVKADNEVISFAHLDKNDPEYKGNIITDPLEFIRFLLLQLEVSSNFA